MTKEKAFEVIEKVMFLLVPELNSLIDYNDMSGWQDSPVSREEVIELKEYIMNKTFNK